MRMAYLEDDGRKLLCLTITKAPSVTMPTICFGLKLKFGSNSCRVNPKSSDRFFTRSRPLSAVIDPLILTMSSDCTVASFRCKFRPMYLWFSIDVHSSKEMENLSLLLICAANSRLKFVLILSERKKHLFHDLSGCWNLEALISPTILNVLAFLKLLHWQ